MWDCCRLQQGNTRAELVPHGAMIAGGVLLKLGGCAVSTCVKPSARADSDPSVCAEIWLDMPTGMQPLWRLRLRGTLGSVCSNQFLFDFLKGTRILYGD
jgi:hypothetical protein